MDNDVTASKSPGAENEGIIEGQREFGGNQPYHPIWYIPVSLQIDFDNHLSLMISVRTNEALDVKAFVNQQIHTTQSVVVERAHYFPLSSYKSRIQLHGCL